MIHNAINYRKNIEDSYVIINILKKNESVVIELKDNGIGIPEELQEKVYDMFFRGNVESQGTGLGLYIVKNSVEKLGGTIEMYSQVREGTSFSITLPN